MLPNIAAAGSGMAVGVLSELRLDDDGFPKPPAGSSQLVAADENFPVVPWADDVADVRESPFAIEPALVDLKS